MELSIPTVTTQTATNVVDATPTYNSGNTYTDGELVQYTETTGLLRTGIFAVFNIDTSHSLRYYSVLEPDAPFDAKQYTKAYANDTMTYTITSPTAFDTIAIGGVIADTVTALFKDSGNQLIFTIADFPINNLLEEGENRHEEVPTTQVLYSPNDVDGAGTVELTFTRTGKQIEVGTLLLGLSLSAGFTHLELTNSFIDYSPYEKDQWGNVTYIEGVKINVHAGNVDLPIADYDQMTRIMLTIGGRTTIVNGHGIKTNQEPDEAKGHFYATMLIGRIKDFRLKTNIRNKRLGELATYSFSIEENV